jgi:hypothetical protein
MVLAVCSLFTASAAAEDKPLKPHWTVDVPKGQHVEERSYDELAIAGAAVFGASWIATIAMTAATVKEHRGQAVGHSVVPVAGPFIELSQSYNTRAIAPILVITGGGEALGLLGLFVGVTIDSRVLVPDGHARLRISPAGAGLNATLEL